MATYRSPYEPNNNLQPVVLFWNRRCDFCHIPLLTNEKSGFCCGPQGRHLASVPRLPPLPSEYNYFLNDPEISHKSRKLNLIYSFAALQTTATFPNTLDGVIAVQGKVYHQVRPNHERSGARWVLYDGYMRDAAPGHDWLSDLPTLWTDALATALLRVNPLSRSLRALSASLPQLPSANIVLRDAGTSEIAAIMRHDNSTSADLGPRSLVIMPHNATGDEVKVSVSSVSRFWEPLVYPLFFPHATLGWGVPGADAGVDGEQGNGPQDGDVASTQIWHYRVRLLHDPRFEIFGRLTNEYLVDMFSRNLETRLYYIRQNQERLRRADALLMDDGDGAPSENVYLPASFLGSRRWAAEQVADALAIAAIYGTPTFFVTMTSNPNWPEITACLRPGQTWADVPLIVARVFAQKLSLLMAKLSDIFHGAGAKQYSIQVVEFQKRGLPHAHILIKFTANCTDIVDINAAVSAEMPTNPEDAALVMEFMIHSHGPYCQREKDGRMVCRFGYIKPITPETWIDDEGRVQYRRRTDRDLMVVPYNIQLLRLFRCHINIEVASPSQIFQYMFKYIHKGPDRAHFNIVGNDEPVDEIAEYWAGRYLSATEAGYRILGKNITRKSPGVTPLPVHLPDSHVFRQYSRRAGNESQMSLLDRYFCRPIGFFLDQNRLPQPFSSLRYTEYYQLFRQEKWDGVRGEDRARGVFLEQPGPPGQRRMIVIQRSPLRPHVTRLMPVKPSAGEPYYLRALLKHAPASSFEDLRSVEGNICGTFQEAATALGLFEDQREAEACMTEAIVEALCTPRQVRYLFVDLLVNDCCHHPITLWETFREPLSYDFYLQHGQNSELAEELALQEISHWLSARGHSLQEVTLWTNELRARAEAAAQRLNPEQAAIFHEIMEAVRLNRPLFIFIDGKAGRGKTFLLNALCDAIRASMKIVIPTATSAYAAQLYRGGRTAHSVFKIPVNENSEMLESPIEAHHGRGELLREAALIIWDEIPMANRGAVACSEEVLRKVCMTNIPFGGKVVAAVGDYRQTCPVVRGGSRPQIVDASLRSSPLWPLFTIRHLITPIRNAADPEYAAYVDAIGDGAGPEVPIWPFIPTVTLASELIAFTFPPQILRDPETSVSRSILAPTNEQVDAYNAVILDQMEGFTKTFMSADSIKEVDQIDGLRQDAAAAILDYAARRPPPGLPPHSLTIKVGAVYRLMRNMAPERGCVKNARAVIHGVGNRLVAVRLMRPENGNRPDDEITLLPRIPFETTVYSGHTLVRRQFPLAPAYATTFNSCQGLTLDRVGVDLTRPVFSHGQLYTALSRVRTRADIAVRLLPGETTTQNVTYHDILL